MLLSRRFLVLTAWIFVGAAVVFSGSWWLTSSAARKALDKSARIAASDTAEYFAAEFPEIERMIQGAPPTPEQRHFVRDVIEHTRVFVVKLFGPDGELKFDSRYMDPHVAEQPLPTEARVQEARHRNEVHQNWPAVFAAKGDGERLPRFYAEAVERLIADGKQIGHLEVSIDQTARAQGAYEIARSYGAGIAALTTLAYLVPALGFLWGSQQQLRTREEMLKDARNDPLTGLVNRASFKELVDGKIEEAGTEHAFSIHFVDLDRFKDVNDTRGHAVGDELLRRAARRLTKAAGPDACVCRLGGDEFAIFQHGNTSEENSRLAERIIADLGEPFWAKDEIRIGASVGIARYPEDGRSTFDLLKAADLALYDAKRLGRGCFSFYHPAMQAREDRRASVKQRLIRAIDRHEFEIHYQPIYAMPGRALSGFEALLRLSDEEGGIPTSEFIAVAEETGAMDRLGKLVLEEACRTATYWQSGLIVAVNLSAAQFQAGTLVGFVREALATSGLPPRRLELEVTESILMADPDAVALQLDSLREMGVSIALDDFGTGYSSLSYLWAFPFDKLKIDGSFIRNLEQGNERSEAFLNSVVALGEALGLSITVEGVQTSSQAEQISRMNVNFVQGYHYGRPMPSQAKDSLLREDRQGSSEDA